MTDFHFLRREAGLTISDCATLFDVTPRTIKYWETRKPQKAAYLYLQIANGKLDHLGKEWNGFKIRKNCIESPEGDFIYHYEVRALRYLYHAAGINRTGVLNNLSNQHESPTIKRLQAVKCGG